MTKRFASALLALTLLVSCSRNNDDAATVNATNGWKLGTTSYTAAYTMRLSSGSTNALTAMDAVPNGNNTSTMNTFIAYFATLPTASGTYRVASYPSALTATQVGIVAGGPNATYASTGAGAVDATVTVSGGKITVTVPAVTLKKTNSTEELTASGTIKEQ